MTVLQDGPMAYFVLKLGAPKLPCVEFWPKHLELVLTTRAVYLHLISPGLLDSECEKSLFAMLALGQLVGALSNKYTCKPWQEVEAKLGGWVDVKSIVGVLYILQPLVIDCMWWIFSICVPHKSCLAIMLFIISLFRSNLHHGAFVVHSTSYQ